MANDNLRDYGRMGIMLTGVSRCPHCGIANPQLPRLWQSEQQLDNSTGLPASRWAIYRCTTCGDAVSAKGAPGANVGNPLIIKVFPTQKEAHDDIPDIARQFLQQAYETLHAPDAAAVMAGSAVDAMLKAKGYEDGSLYLRIDKAVEDHVLTESMGLWAHEVRLGSNRPRHADKDNPHVSPEEAVQSVDFAESLVSVRKEVDSLESFVILLWPPIRFSGGGRC